MAWNEYSLSANISKLLWISSWQVEAYCFIHHSKADSSSAVSACRATSNSWHALWPVQSPQLRDGNFSQRVEQISCPSLILQVLSYSTTQLTFMSLISSKTPGQHSPAIGTLFLQSHQRPIKPCNFFSYVFPSSYVNKHTKQQFVDFCMLHAWISLCFFILPEFFIFTWAKIL